MKTSIKCLLFSLGIPGLFGRNFLIYADQLNDNFGEKLYNIQINPVVVLLQTVGVFLRLVFIAPLHWIVAFCNFYFQRNNGSAKDIIKHFSAANTRAELKESKKIEKQAKALEAETAAKSKDAEKEKPKEEAKKEKPKEEASKDKDEKKPELKKETKAKDLLKEDDKKDDQQPTPLSVKPAQNWCDFFFIIDSLSYNIDICDFILFMNKLHPTITNIDTKKVNVDASYLETGTNTLVFSYNIDMCDFILFMNKLHPTI